VDVLDAYLEMLFGAARRDDWIELRRRVADDRMASDFFRVGMRELAAKQVRRYGRWTDVYVDCAPRTRRSGRKEAVGASWVVWADCDGQAPTELARTWDPAPTMMVRSGSAGATQAYWRLAAPLSPPQLELANLRLAKTLGADPQCHDAGRILRPPATFNHKRSPAAPVTLDSYAPARVVEITDVLAAAEPLRVSAVQRRWDERPARDARGDRLLQIAPREYVRALLGVAPGRNGKVPCPFHEDERPSLHVYESAERGWCCFSCGRGGSVYDLAAGLWGLETRGRQFVQLRARLL
jgi:hypothetical protein